jgi:hypothetical protein
VSPHSCTQVEAANRDAEEEKRKRLEALAQRKAEKLAAEKVGECMSNTCGRRPPLC